MPISRKLVAQDDSEVNQWLKVDHSSRFIVNDSPEWQFLFGINSTLSASNQIIKISARFDDSTFNNIKIIAYLYDQQNASIGNANSCVLNIYKSTIPNWTETLITTLTTTQLSNSYFYANPTLSSLLPDLSFEGGDSIMIEATITRLGVTYRDRVYINHLGIYDNVTRLRQDVEFLDIIKADE